ncbi:DNA polymerase III subunit beta [Oceanobacillus massiliensis]|uniref:DNA polymerase III subunit beta n=1 Tax=Oceanobacillus massiliensis TaxID=1465765 RepID=UPI000287BB0F|nr:DNA polymerase III subunit beta [Oceanobacillus massiliensis]
MEFKINNDYFNKAISDVSKAVSSKTPHPILTGIKIVAKADSLTLIGSNSDIVIEREIPKASEGLNILEVYETGSVVISAKYLCEIIKKLPNDIYIKVNENQSMTIQSEEIVTKLNGLNAKEYPKLPEFKLSNSIRIASDVLLDIIKQTVFAASKSETRPVLTGVNFYFQKDLLTCVATNSQRLSLVDHKIQSNLNGSFIVPSTSLIEFLKLINSYTKEIDIFVTETNILFKSNTISLYSRLIEGSYPNISGLIPRKSSTMVTLDTKQLLKGIERACIFASEWRNNNINFQIEDKSKIKISSKSSDVGQVEEIQYIKSISGEADLNVSIDGNFMMDALKTIKEGEVSLSFNGSMRPILIVPFGNDSHLQLISPVRSY